MGRTSCLNAPSMWPCSGEASVLLSQLAFQRPSSRAAALPAFQRTPSASAHPRWSHDAPKSFQLIINGLMMHPNRFSSSGGWMQNPYKTIKPLEPHVVPATILARGLRRFWRRDGDRLPATTTDWRVLRWGRLRPLRFGRGTCGQSWSGLGGSDLSGLSSGHRTNGLPIFFPFRLRQNRLPGMSGPRRAKGKFVR
jgi:hypothetical protein